MPVAPFPQGCDSQNISIVECPLGVKLPTENHQTNAEYFVGLYNIWP